MNTVLLLLGSNLGDKCQNLSSASQLIAENIGKITRQSSIYETAAWGKTDQPIFYNQAIEISTILPPETLLSELKKIEQKTGRTQAEKWSARIIDIDIIFYENVIYQSETLTIPHAFMQERNFVLAPLNEIAPDFSHPILQQTVSELLKKSPDKLGVKPI